MIIIELRQGYYTDLTGMSKTGALAMMAQADADFLATHPEAAKYHEPSWREFEARDDDTAPWGREWYVVEADSRLRLHSAYYDSSG